MIKNLFVLLSLSVVAVSTGHAASFRIDQSAPIEGFSTLARFAESDVMLVKANEKNAPIEVAKYISETVVDESDQVVFFGEVHQSNESKIHMLNTVASTSIRLKTAQGFNCLAIEDSMAFHFTPAVITALNRADQETAVDALMTRFNISRTEAVASFGEQLNTYRNLVHSGVRLVYAGITLTEGQQFLRSVNQRSEKTEDTWERTVLQANEYFYYHMVWRTTAIIKSVKAAIESGECRRVMLYAGTGHFVNSAAAYAEFESSIGYPPGLNIPYRYKPVSAAKLIAPFKFKTIDYAACGLDNEVPRRLHCPKAFQGTARGDAIFRFVTLD